MKTASSCTASVCTATVIRSCKLVVTPSDFLQHVTFFLVYKTVGSLSTVDNFAQVPIYPHKVIQ